MRKVKFQMAKLTAWAPVGIALASVPAGAAEPKYDIQKQLDDCDTTDQAGQFKGGAGRGVGDSIPPSRSTAE
jgi:hypothetical protein